MFIQKNLLIFKKHLQEKNLKKWQHSWKIELIEKTNPEWKDLIK
ncbi:putative excinuclease ABC, C subunit, N-terminal [Rickettsia parkeri str. Tate's Hell]|uniref:Excinuclease ABC, C subunit, N-terminal n=1 Tax=Rickettsia parkeri str. Tate's Hell TaxID=1359189 RepID=A0ABR5DRI2_RICPA|nr:putative excinuclease ABC, C subunit, N-terminal [Rickettsia parkeri str. AT\